MTIFGQSIATPRFFFQFVIFIGDGRRFYTDGRHVHEFLKEMVHDAGIENMTTVGEMSSTSLDNCVRYTAPKEKELSMVFSFHHLKVDYKDGDKWSLMKPDLMKRKDLSCTWQEGMQAEEGWNAVFWCNHDQPRAVSRFGNEDKYWKESAIEMPAGWEKAQVLIANDSCNPVSGKLNPYTCIALLK